jgi:hypothetical protein
MIFRTCANVTSLPLNDQKPTVKLSSRAHYHWEIARDDGRKTIFLGNGGEA